MCFVIFVTQCFPLQHECFHCAHIFLRSYSVLRIDFFGKHCVHVIKHCHMYDLSLCSGNHFPSFVWFRMCDKQFVVVYIFHWSKLVLQECQEDNNSSPECVLHFYTIFFYLSKTVFVMSTMRFDVSFARCRHFLRGIFLTC